MDINATEEEYATPIQFIREWQVVAATVIGIGAKRKGDYHQQDMPGMCEELIRLEEAFG